MYKWGYPARFFFLFLSFFFLQLLHHLPTTPLPAQHISSWYGELNGLGLRWRWACHRKHSFSQIAIWTHHFPIPLSSTIKTNPFEPIFFSLLSFVFFIFLPFLLSYPPFLASFSCAQTLPISKASLPPSPSHVNMLFPHTPFPHQSNSHHLN